MSIPCFLQMPTSLSNTFLVTPSYSGEHPLAILASSCRDSVSRADACLGGVGGGEAHLVSCCLAYSFEASLSWNSMWLICLLTSSCSNWMSATFCQASSSLVLMDSFCLMAFWSLASREVNRGTPDFCASSGPSSAIGAGESADSWLIRSNLWGRTWASLSMSSWGESS